MKIKLLKNLCNPNGFFPVNSILEFPDSIAKQLIKSNQGILVEEQEKVISQESADLIKKQINLETANLTINQEVSTFEFNKKLNEV